MQKKIIDRIISRHLGNIFPPFVAVAILGSVTLTFASDIKVSGGMSLGYEWYDRKYDKEDQSVVPANEVGNVAGANGLSERKDDKSNRFRIAPLIEVASVSARDDLSLHYSPSFRYDNETYTHDVDHDFTASIKRLLTRDWRLLLTEKYLLTDMVNDQYANGADTVVKLSNNGNRRKYWTNNASLASEYSYWESSLFSLGYNYGILENIDVTAGDNYENYDRHEAQFSVDHRYNSFWKQKVSGSYVRGLYDVNTAARAATGINGDNDLNEYRASTKLEAHLIEHHPMSLGYSYFDTEYDAADRSGGAIHDVTLGWQWLITKDWTYSLGGGPSYEKTEGQDGNWGYNANTALQYGFERGSLALSANRGYERQNFNGTNENGLSKFWQSRIDIKYEFLKDVSSQLFADYHYEDQEVVTGLLPVSTDSGETASITQATTVTDTFNRKRFSAGTSIGYKFWQWYTVTLSYDYAVQKSEQLNDSYDEHRIFLTLSMHTDLLNW